MPWLPCHGYHAMATMPCVDARACIEYLGSLGERAGERECQGEGLRQRLVAGYRWPFYPFISTTFLQGL